MLTWKKPWSKRSVERFAQPQIRITTSRGPAIGPYAFDADSSGAAAVVERANKSCSAWIETKPGKESFCRTEFRSLVDVAPLSKPDVVTFSSHLRAATFSWADALDGGIAVMHATARVDVALDGIPAGESSLRTFYEYSAIDHGRYFPTTLWEFDLSLEAAVPAGDAPLLVVTEIVEIHASANEAAFAYMDGHFAWKPLVARIQ